ncbi:hypothetical protein [Candidatus Palauibacter sp.]|uniref:hypothetical protein n=1 Tax=Candidatus Palauibacter sp. TaxID=3101350 RepID=UPI003CC594F5
MNPGRRNRRACGAMKGLLLSGLFAACGGDDPVSPAPPPHPTETATLSGAITQSMELDPDLTYHIQGTTIVEAGATLTIPAGTLLLGDVNFTGSALIVRQGGRLVARGTAQEPIVFTSSNPEGSRRRGDWGGVVLNGRSNCNFPSDECVGEGNSGPYGGTMPDDDSGQLSYVRIEYGGLEVSFGNELNGLTLNGVGSGTQLDHIQSHHGSDDGIEFFGGTVDLKYAYVTGASDDSFDYSSGWQGRGQFWAAQQDPHDADNGFEVDGNEENFDAEPFTDPDIYNVTLVGKEAGTGSAGESSRGIIFRRGTAGRVYNVVILGFENGFDVDQQETAARIQIRNSYVFGQEEGMFESDDGAESDPPIDEEALWNTDGWGNVAGVDPLLVDPFNLGMPDFRPAAGSPLTDDYAEPPAGSDFFDAVDYIGAFAPGMPQWIEGWITQDQG